jgi:AcrR family transcriptional regulator
MRGRALEQLRVSLAQKDWSSQTPARARIVDAFLALALAKGFDAVTMRTIAKAVDIKAPSIYTHFPNGKDEIVTESLHWHFFQFGTALLQSVNDEQSPEKFWEGLVRLHFVRQLTLPESNIWDLLVQADRLSSFFPADLRVQVSEWEHLHENLYIAAAQDLGCMKPLRQVKLVIALLEGSTRWADPADDFESAITRAVRISRRILAIG